MHDRRGSVGAPSSSALLMANRGESDVELGGR
jgi:hypothetical protein